MPGIVQRLTMLAVRLPEKVTDGNVTKQTAWILLSLFCVTWYVYDARFGVGDRNAVEDRRLRAHESIIVF